MNQTELWAKVDSLREEKQDLKKDLLAEKARLTEALSIVEKMLKELESSPL